MSSFKIALVVLVSVAGLNACGYTPLYGRSGPSAQMVRQLASVQIEPIPNRVGQMMRTELRRGLSPKGPMGAHAYRLYVILSESISTLAVEQNAFATRSNLNLQAKYRLVRTADGIEMTKGRANMVASYNILSSDFATQSARSNARKLAIVGLSQIVRTRLAVYLRGPGDRVKSPAR